MYDIRARADRVPSRPRRAPRPAAPDLSWLPASPLSADEQALVDDLRALIDLGLVRPTGDLGDELRLALAEPPAPGDAPPV